MPKWLVIGYVSATSSARVDADTAVAAAESADLDTGLCHQCARRMDVGDIYSVEVSDESGEVVLKDDGHPDADRQAREDARTLAAHLARTKGLPTEVAAAVARWRPAKKPRAKKGGVR